MTTLTIKHFFDAAHQLNDSKFLITKECARLHGHTYAVEVTISGDENEGGMVIDFKAVKNIIDRFDHRFINDVFKGYEIDLEPTAENIAQVIHEWISSEDKFLDVMSVSVCEGYKGQERASWATYQRADYE